MIDKTKFIRENDRNNWILNNTGKYFLDKEVYIVISTSTDSEDPITEIFDEQIETVNIILSNWDVFAKQVEEGILSYENISKEQLEEVVYDPHIWLGMDYETKLPWENNKWSVVVGVTVSNDFGWHTEFEGSRFLETWAGD